MSDLKNGVATNVATNEENVENQAKSKVTRRGVAAARGTTRLKFTHELAKQNGLFIGHLESVTVSMIQIGEDKTGMPSFNGLEIPKIVLTFASNETEEYMPFAISMAHKLAKRLTEVRKNGTLPYLRPDGKTQVTVEYEDGKVKRIDTILISTQHNEDIEMEKLKNDLMENVIKEVISCKYLDDKTKYYINPTGRFVIGGPLGDTGLTGRKIIVDTYGGYARHGGGAFSGKDATKVDRSAAYMLRHIAKNIVANGFAKKCEIQVAYAIGMEQPMSIYVDTFGTNTISEEEITEIIKRNFDLTPNGIIEYLHLQEPIFTKTTNYGHFGKSDLPWEKIIKLK